ncbi:MAG: hypothetical protein ABIU54_05550 [Candidatus Eisenbacteria bacterium]
MKPSQAHHRVTRVRFAAAGPGHVVQLVLLPALQVHGTVHRAKRLAQKPRLVPAASVRSNK